MHASFADGEIDPRSVIDAEPDPGSVVEELLRRFEAGELSYPTPDA
jgi:hypothetical protein